MYKRFLRGYTSVFRAVDVCCYLFSLQTWKMFFFVFRMLLWSECILIYFLKIIQQTFTTHNALPAAAVGHKIYFDIQMNFHYFSITFRLCIILCVALTILWICFRYRVIGNDKNAALSNDINDDDGWWCNDTVCDVDRRYENCIPFDSTNKIFSLSNFYRKPKHGRD